MAAMITSTHRVLANDELLRLILEYFHLEPIRVHETLPCIFDFSLTEDDYLSCKTLASCAQVCKGLSDPALDVLWYDLRDFSRLLRLLPSSFTVQSAKPPSPYTVSCHVPKNTRSGIASIDLSEWSRLHRYAKRVRRLRYNRSGLDSSILEWFRKCFICDPIFPNLQVFQWQQHPSNLQSELMHFVTPSLRTFTFSDSLFNSGLPWKGIVPNAHDSEYVIDTLRRRAPGLRNLSLSNTTLSTTAVRMCGDFPNLLNLRITDTIKPADFIGSISLVSLTSQFESLDIDVNLLPEEMRYPDMQKLKCTTPPRVVLPTLTSITLRGDLRPIKNVLLQLVAPQVHTVGMIERKPCGDDVNSDHAVIPCIETGCIAIQETPTISIRVPSVRGLDECRVYLYRENLWSLDDKEFVKMCKAWPKPPSITSRSLLTIAKHCPHLTSLRIPIIGGDLSRTDEITPSSNLKTFAVSLPEELYVDVLALASYVNRVAPNMDIKASQRFLQSAYEAEPRKLLYKRLFRVLSLLQGADDPLDFVKAMEELVLDPAV
ncbi:hypothetical protein QCA50_007815 [Cerrena zonata]|uniref:F-box domain-containing protein n=1 Tax=Cerrena zonata TaxID=2478898 RepID=A0AAW0GH62_9APHY